MSGQETREGQQADAAAAAEEADMELALAEPDPPRFVPFESVVAGVTVRSSMVDFTTNGERRRIFDVTLRRDDKGFGFRFTPEEAFALPTP